ncbi:MAG: leucine-rich repeat protein, partial [Lachnospiraceae bacterium]|nr:leucine-rich repeat protein [Lachnospiraceae bacterium]
VLELPNTVDAYRKYIDNLGGNGQGYCAVGKSGNFLFYKKTDTHSEYKLDANGEKIPKTLTNEDGTPATDEEGNPVYQTDESGNIIYLSEEVSTTSYMPCYFSDEGWQGLTNDDYYYLDSAGKYQPATDSSHMRITNAQVRYVGNQYLTTGTGADEGVWKIANNVVGGKNDYGIVDTPEKGIFRGGVAGNIVTLKIGSNLCGIGDYAFNGCANMTSLELANGLDTIGNHAFENCINMRTVEIAPEARLTTIGAYAFYNCDALQDFSTPVMVTNIGDYAFAECNKLKNVYLCGVSKDTNMLLSNLGQYVFENCPSLSFVEFPDNVVQGSGKDGFAISLFNGCTALEHVTFPNPKADIVGSEDEFNRFINTVPETFYLEGVPNAALHATAREAGIAFRYLGQDIYEITKEYDNGSAVYQVNSANQLIKCELNGNISDIELPRTIGPYNISTIWSSSFQNKCSLEKITIPSSIQVIEADAFRGCHNLKTVIFTEPVNITSIGANAFKTQDFSLTKHDDACKDPGITKEPSLVFVGPVSYSCVPFDYAMNADNYINTGTQNRTYITYYSGWPSNLAVKYDLSADKNELIGYPTYYNLTGYTMDTYPYMTADYVNAASNAVNKLANKEKLTDYEEEIIDAALNIHLPEGIESIKKGLFTENDVIDNLPGQKTLVADGLLSVDNNAFKGCTNFKAIYLNGLTTSVGDYVFEDCSNLEEMYLPSSLSRMGKRPFKGCTKLKDVGFQGNPNFKCDNSIIFGTDENGNKKTIIEFLEGRTGGYVTAKEVEGVDEIAPEAFSETAVSSVDLRDSTISEIPSLAFSDTQKLFSVYLPDTWKSIADDAFKNSALKYLEIPGMNGFIGNNAFSPDTINDGLTFCCEDDSAAYYYAVGKGIPTTTKIPEVYYTVTFWDYDNSLLDTQKVAAGADAVAPEVSREGYTLKGWVPDYHGVNGDLQVTAQYEAIDPESLKYTVTFVDWDDSVIITRKVASGEAAEAPVPPTREGYEFTGWRPEITNITADTTVYAQYTEADGRFTVRFLDYDSTVLYTQLVEPGQNAMEPKDPVREGYTFTGWLPNTLTNITKDLDVYATYVKGSGTDSGTPATPGPSGTSSATNQTPAPNGSSSTTNNTQTSQTPLATGTASNSGSNGQGTQAKSAAYYTLTVKNGSGSGSYLAGTQPIIVANDPATGQAFKNWTSDSEDLNMLSTSLSATAFTMPQHNVTITANYENKPSSKSSSSVSSNTAAPSTVQAPKSTKVSSRTTVVIDKNGLSNTGVVSATVNGSSDNFTIKVSETAQASEAAVKALMSEYGDISNIKYFPMDISLYDSTGTQKITDTTGLSVSITLPLPDSLVTYAGNNKTAGIVNDKLDKLKSRFTTISGVPCVTFTAEHFSPYVIYVDTGNLKSSGTSIDNTPRTGDGVHPKWFLSSGLACLSLVFFLKKDKRRAAKR